MTKSSGKKGRRGKSRSGAGGGASGSEMEAMVSAAHIKPLRILLLGRLNPRRAGGGIARSAHLMTKALRSVGDIVTLADSRFDVPVPPGTNIVVHYSDMDGIEGHIRRAQAAGVPIIVNAVYDQTRRRSSWIVDQFKHWKYRKAKMFVFSAAARDDPRLVSVRHRLVVMPKTIRAVTGHREPLSYAQRSGICLGELAKARRSYIVGDGPGADEAVRRLQEALPGVPLHFYNQYSVKTSVAPAGCSVRKYQQRGFLTWLGQFRLFISLSRHETFAMVPLEAQSNGTVVLYRHQPQSLTEYLSYTGIGFETADEMVQAARALYFRQSLWEQYSLAGRHNAQARSFRLVGAAIDMALRKAML